MKYSELESYLALTNHFDKADNYYEIMPYALKMQKLGMGHYEFYDSYLKIRFNDTFDARNIAGTLSVRPGMLNFRTFSMNSQEGSVSGNGLVVQNRDKSFLGRGSFAVNGVVV